jgi:serine/threonine protein kinase
MDSEAAVTAAPPGSVSHPIAPPEVKCPACEALCPQGGACFGCGTPLPASARFAPGTILDSYRLDEVLGEGGMGIVYLATHTRLGRRVAIKVLRPEYSDNPQALRRFFAEARAVNKISHPNIIEITDFVDRPGDVHYCVMELLDGVSLAELISTGGILSLPRSLAIMTQVAEALGAVHRGGIVHGDLKPHNVVMIERAGQTDFVKLVDFGIARFVGTADDAVSVHDSGVGAILGTPKYMSPEQASGKSIDHRSDIYSFGVVLYELVTGLAPHAGADFGEFVVSLHTVAPTPPHKITGLPHEVPKSLEDLILACLAKDPSERPGRIEQVAERLVAIADEQNWIIYELSLTPKPYAQIAQILDDDVLAPTPRVQAPEPPLDSTRPPVVAGAARPAAAPVRGVWPIAGAGAVAVAIAIVALLVSSGRGSGSVSPDASGSGIHAKVQSQLAIADERIAAGRFVGPGGNEALDHLLAARALDPADPGVRDRLGAIARKFEHLADQALAADRLEEAAVDLQAVLMVEPNNEAAANKMNEIEAKILKRQRAKPHRR